VRVLNKQINKDKAGAKQGLGAGCGC